MKRGLAIAVLGWLSAVSPLALPGASETVIPQIRAFLDRERIGVGEKALLTVEVGWEGDASALELKVPAPPDCHLVRVAGSAQRSAAVLSGGIIRQAHQFRFTLQGEEKGQGRVGYVQVSYRRPGESEEHSLRSEPLNVTVAADGSSGALTLLLIFIVLALAVVAGWRVRASRRRVAPPAPAVPRRDPTAAAMEELGTAKKLKVEGKREEYYRHLFGVLSGYLKEKYSRPFTRDGWSESLQSIPAPDLDDATRAEIRDIFTVLEQARFGSYPPAEAEEMLFRRVYSLLKFDPNMGITTQPLPK